MAPPTRPAQPVQLRAAVALWVTFELFDMVMSEPVEDAVASCPTAACCVMVIESLAQASWATVHVLPMVMEPWTSMLPLMLDPLLQFRLPFVYTSPSFPTLPLTFRLF